jgi:transcription elongation factor GreB
VLVDPPAAPTDEVRFGAKVIARDAEGRERHLQIVGVDEANGREGKVAFVAPIARALLGRRRGDRVTLRSPRGEEELEVVDIEYDEHLDEHPR